MRRADLRAAIVTAVVLGGCMRIYPDPELPDVEVSWFEEDCRPETPEIVLALVGVDTTSRVEVTVPCADVGYTFRDVARERFRVEGALHDTDGNVFAAAESDADLRNGLNERIELYFGAFSNFRVGWAFDMGASCASLGATAVAIGFVQDGEPTFEYREPCFASAHFNSLPSGIFTVGLRALVGEQTVATSPESGEFTITNRETFVDVGVLTLTPCGASCP